jgi:hypothetical protein
MPERKQAFLFATTILMSVSAGLAFLSGSSLQAASTRCVLAPTGLEYEVGACATDHYFCDGDQKTRVCESSGSFSECMSYCPTVPR